MLVVSGGAWKRTCDARIEILSCAVANSLRLQTRYDTMHGLLQLDGRTIIGIPDLFKQDANGRPEGAFKFNPFERTSKALDSSTFLLFRKLIKAPSLYGLNAVALAHQRKHVVPHSAQHVFGLQKARSSYTRTHVQRIEPRHSNQLVRIRSRR